MSRKCKVCTHFYKIDIERRLVFKEKTGETFASIARDYEHITSDSLKRHFANHMTISAAKCETADQEIDPDTMLSAAEIDSWKCYKIAMEKGDMAIAQKALSNALECLKLRRKDEEAGRTEEVNLSDSQEWIALRSKILAALEEYPEARDALAEALA